MTVEILPSHEKGVIYEEGARKFASPFRQTGGPALRGLVDRYEELSEAGRFDARSSSRALS